MFISLLIVCTLLGLTVVGSAVGKLTAKPNIIQSMHAVGVNDSGIRILAILEILGGTGLLVGIWVPALGTAAAAALTLYFLGAVAAHLRVHDAVAVWAPAFVIMLLAVAAAVLQLQR